MSGIVNCPDHGENSQLGSAQQQQEQQNPETESQQQLPEDQSHQQQDSAKEESARQDNKQGQGEENTEESSCKHENTDVHRETEGKKKSLFHYTCKMLSDLLLIGFLLSNLFSYVLNSNESVKRKTRSPEPFFSENSLVRDYWEGEVFQAFKDAHNFESSFFMFYAAWDRESEESRQILDDVAVFYRKSDVMIAAVNCWYPTSDCAKEFGGKNGTGHVLPVFIFYPNSMNGIQYRGHITPSHIIRFISVSRKPVVHLHSVHHLINLQVEYENVLVGYLPQTHTTYLNPSHQELISTALELHEVLAEKLVCTAAVTSEQLAKQLSLHVTKPVKLYTHNNSFVFPNKTIDSEKVVYWTLKNLTPPLNWLNLHHKKSLGLKRILEDGSGNVLLLFSPRDHLYEDKVYDILRQVSIDYQNCDRSEGTLDLVKRLKEKTSGSSCKTSPQSSPATPSITSPSSCNLRSWSVENPEESFPACSQASPCSDRKNGTGGGECAASLRKLRSINYLMDKNSPVDTNILLAIQELEIEKRNTEKMSQGQVFSNMKSETVDITGLGCSSNKTLRFYRVDTNMYSTLLERLGLESRPLPVPVILNTKMEAIHVQELRNGHIEEDLRKMILAYHQGTLPDNGKQGYRSINQESVIRYKLDLERNQSPDSVLKDLGAETFSEEISGDFDTVLLITSSFCSDCTTFSYIFHTAKMYLQKIPSLKFMLVDGTKNDLKWQFNTFSYPAIVFFPKNRPESSRAYPMDEGVNLPNLLRFILSNLSPLQRLALNLNYCDNHCMQKFRLRSEKSIEDIIYTLKNHHPLPVQIRHKLISKLKYTKGILALTDQLLSQNKNEEKRNLSVTTLQDMLENQI